MHFDDRLDTVLKLPDEGGAIARVQFRQLLSILGRMREDERTESVERAYARIDALCLRVPAPERVAVLGEPMSRIESPRLLVLLASKELSVAEAAIRATRFADEQWLRVLPDLSPRVRSMLRDRDDLGDTVHRMLGSGDNTAADNAWEPRLVPQSTADAPAEGDDNPHAQPVAEYAPVGEDFPVAEDAPYGDEETVADTAEVASQPPPSPVSPFASPFAAQVPPEPAAPPEPFVHSENVVEPLRRIDDGGRRIAAADTIDFVTNTGLRIVSADGHFAPSLVGLSLTPGGSGEPVQADPQLATSLRHRQPLRAARIKLRGAPAIDGTWQLDAVPLFDSDLGRFTGYAGRLRRALPPPAAPESAAQAEGQSESDRIRQILHELRTPANAIQVAAEIIQQQLYGPAPHEYRALAASIAGDTARILAGFDELDRLAKLESGVMTFDGSETDLAPIVQQQVERIRAFTDPSGCRLVIEGALPALPAGLEMAEAEALVWRLLATLAGLGEPGETLCVTAAAMPRTVSLTIDLPRALAAGNDAATPPSGDVSGSTLSTGMFGAQFSLRLAAAEARGAGGRLVRDDHGVTLQLPAANAPASGTLLAVA